jgi:hypothetical protein
MKQAMAIEPAIETIPPPINLVLRSILASARATQTNEKINAYKHAYHLVVIQISSPQM